MAEGPRIQFDERPDWGREQAVRGSPARPLDDAALVGKFTDCVGRARQPKTAPAAVALARRLLAMQAEPSVAALPW